MSEKIGVVGAGLMGAEIALGFALAGHEVLLSDRGEAELKTALERLARVLDRGIGRGFYKEEEKPAALSRIRTTTALDEFADRDFVTEAVFESEEVKAEVYRTLDRSEHAALAEAVAGGLADPSREPAQQPFARALARRALEIAGEVALGRLSAADVSRRPGPVTRS